MLNCKIITFTLMVNKKACLLQLNQGKGFLADLKFQQPMPLIGQRTLLRVFKSTSGKNDLLAGA